MESKFYYDVFLSTFEKNFERKISYVFPMSVSGIVVVYIDNVKIYELQLSERLRKLPPEV